MVLSCAVGSSLTGPDSVLPEYLAGSVADCPARYRATGLTPGQYDDFIAADQTRSFLLAMPNQAAFPGPRPLLMAFNGTGETGPSFFDRADLGDFVDRGFIVVAPSDNKNGKIWPVWDAQRQPGDDSPNADLEYFDKLTSCLAYHLPIDRNRYYIAGHSAGGIMTNFLLQKRSELIAGGIVASGIMALTGQADDPPLRDTFVLITWGGDDDTFSNPAVSQVDFPGEAAIASVFYSRQDNVGQAYCRVASGSSRSGHIWLPINNYLIDRLLEHPKGFSGKEGVTLPEAQPAADIMCGSDTVIPEGGVEISCGASSKPSCQTNCQLIADCGAENTFVGGVISAELGIIGFRNAECDDCVTNCENNSGGAGDADVLACIDAAQATAMCGQGLAGAQPLIDAINMCCTGATNSEWCGFMCNAISMNDLAGPFFTACS